MKRILLIIDPQEDFCNPATGALYVTGAEHDMERIAAVVRRIAFDDVYVTLDTHHVLDIAHPGWWCDSNGNPPAPFTIITAEAVATGHWHTTDPANQARGLAYVQALERNGNYPLCIWPPHCRIGSVGNAVAPILFAALPDRTHYLRKGENPFTEHYSAIAADVPDPDDPTTLPNLALVATLARADSLVVCGEAGSHCVANTVRDLVRYGLPAEKIVLLTDALSPVPGFEGLQTAFLEELTEQGARCTTTEALV